MKTRRSFLGVAAKSTVAMGLSKMTHAGQTKMKTGIIHDPIYETHVLQPGHPESPERLKRILAELTTRHLVVPTDPDTLEQIRQRLPRCRCSRFIREG